MRKSFTKFLALTSTGLLLMLICLSAKAQLQVSGKVLSEESEPLPGVNVLIKGTVQGSTTDAEGSFRVEVPDRTSVLVFSFVGYMHKEVIVGDQTYLEVSMTPDIQSLQEIVVIGYGTQTKSNVTSAIVSVKEKDFTAGAMRDASELIKGKVAGLTITNGSGDPASAPNISLRGIATLEGSTAPLILINGIPGSFNTVSPNDIASIDVLKDGSAAAIYGTRGANGVILITTKSGSAKETTLSYHHYSAVSRMFRKADFLTAEEYLDLSEEFDFENSFVEEAELNGGVTSTNWLDEISRQGYMQSHSLTLQGGSTSSNYSANVSYIDQEGVFVGSYNKEFRMSLDMNHYMFDDKLRINLNVLRGTQRIGALGDGNSFNNLIYRNAVIRNPLLAIQDAGGDWIETGRLQYQNPVAMIRETSGEIANNWTRLTSNITLDLLEGWQNTLMVATDIANNYRGYAETSQHYNATRGTRKGGFASRGDDQLRTDYLEFTSKYSRTLKEKHDLSILGGYSYQYNVNEGGWANNQGFPTDAYSYHNLGSGIGLVNQNANMDSYKNDNTLVGFFGRFMYNFDERFLVSASVRREGSSKFGDNYKWGTFPAVSAKWTLTRESFMSGVNFLDELKLRAGFGVTGVIPRDSYRSKLLLSYEGSSMFDNGQWVNGLEAQSNPNPDLRWERTRDFNIGLDFSIFEGRVTGSIDTYVRRTEDMLWEFDVPTPPNVFDRTLANVGEMENKGIEIALGTTPVRAGDFEWNSNVTFSYNKNTLLSLSNDLYQVEGDVIYTSGISEPISMTSHRVKAGRPMGEIWGLKAVDITDDGLFWIIELPDGTRVNMQNNNLANPDNSQVLGNGIPRFLAGWINNFRYKNFDLSVVLNGAFDFQIINQQRAFYENPNIDYNVLTTALDPVFGKSILRYTTQVFHSYYVEDGDYLKVENVTLGYNLNVSSLNFIRSLRVYVSGSNLAILSGYKGIDPELIRNNILIQGTDSRDKYPSIRTFTAGVNVNF